MVVALLLVSLNAGCWLPLPPGLLGDGTQEAQGAHQWVVAPALDLLVQVDFQGVVPDDLVDLELLE